MGDSRRLNLVAYSHHDIESMLSTLERCRVCTGFMSSECPPLTATTPTIRGHLYLAFNFDLTGKICTPMCVDFSSRKYDVALSITVAIQSALLLAG